MENLWRVGRAGVLRAGLPQLPLTCLNSVVSVCALAADLFPLRPVTETQVCGHQ